MKWIKQTVTAVCCACLLAACADGGSPAQDVKKSVDNAAQKAENAADEAAAAGEKTLDDMMRYLKDDQVHIEQEEVIEDIPFAAYDGRSFQLDGHTVYLYRINDQDADMQQLTKQLQQDGLVDVEHNGEKMQYRGELCEDYLLLYEPGVDAKDLIETMNAYVQTK